jgi:hypothetical protein
MQQLGDTLIWDVMVRKGIVCLPIDDDIPVDATERSLAQETMDKVLQTTRRELNRKPHRSVGYLKKVPTTWRRRWDGPTGCARYLRQRILAEHAFARHGPLNVTPLVKATHPEAKNQGEHKVRV